MIRNLSGILDEKLVVEFFRNSIKTDFQNDQPFCLLYGYGARQAALYSDWLNLACFIFSQSQYRAAWRAPERRPNGLLANFKGKVAIIRLKLNLVLKFNALQSFL